MTVNENTLAGYSCSVGSVSRNNAEPSVPSIQPITGGSLTWFALMDLAVPAVGVGLF
jgi:hypothetical protein